MGVIGDVDHELGQDVVLDPPMKYPDESIEPDGLRRLGRHEDFQLQLLRIHGFSC
jgi:hypothetical protein